MRIQSSLDGESQQLILSVTSNLIEKFYPNLCGLIKNTGNLPHGIQISRKDKTTAVVSFPVPQDSIVPVDGNPQMKGVNSTVFAPVIMLIREFTNLSLRNLTKKREFLPLNGYPEEDLQKDVIACLKAKRDIVIIDEYQAYLDSQNPEKLVNGSAYSFNQYVLSYEEDASEYCDVAIMIERGYFKEWRKIYSKKLVHTDWF
jgi:hypothetical protein